MFIEIEYLLTFCIDMIIGHEFTYPFSLYSQKLMPTNVNETTLIT